MIIEKVVHRSHPTLLQAVHKGVGASEEEDVRMLQLVKDGFPAFQDPSMQFLRVWGKLSTLGEDLETVLKLAEVVQRLCLHCGCLNTHRVLQRGLRQGRVIVSGILT